MPKRGKLFMAFDLDKIHNGSFSSARIVEAQTLQEAMGFMGRHYPERSWSVIDKEIFDKGIVTRADQLEEEVA